MRAGGHDPGLHQRLGALLIDSAILLATFVVLFAGSQPVVAQLVALAVNFTYFFCKLSHVGEFIKITNTMVFYPIVNFYL